MLAELALGPAVDLEHAERLAVALQDHVHGPPDAVERQQLGRTEPLLVLEVVGDHRLAGAQRKSGRGGQIGADPGDADHARTPADPCANQQAVLGREVLEHLAESAWSPSAASWAVSVQQLDEGRALQRQHTQLGQQSPAGGCAGQQRVWVTSTRWLPVGLGLDNRLRRLGEAWFMA